MFKVEIDGDSGVAAMVGAVQTFGDLVHRHPHIHAIVPKGVFTESGHLVDIPNVWKHRVEKFRQERVFALLLDEHKINDEIAGNMRGWKHSGFSVDNPVRIENGDKPDMQRLIQYIARCPFSLGRMVSPTKDGEILYRASHARCIPFPLSGDTTLMAGIARNFEVYDPLDFLAEVPRHIPNKGEHPIRYYGHDSNEKRGMQEKKKPGEPKESIELLLSLGLIKKNDEGCFKPTDKVPTTGDVVRDELLRCYQIAITTFSALPLPCILVILSSGVSGF